MSRRLLVAAVCILLLPFWFSASRRETSQGTLGGSQIAYAGRTVMGNHPCTCGNTDCICDPGEEPGLSIEGTQPVSKQRKLGKHGATTGGRGKVEGSDFGQLGLLFALALLFWRLRS